MGRDVTRQKRVVGDARHHQGTRTHGTFFLRSVLRLVVGPPLASKRVRAGLGRDSVFQLHACLFGRRSLYAIAPPSPTLQHRRPPPTAPCLPAPHPQGGIHVAHTVRNALSEEGARVESRAESPELPKKGYGLESQSTKPWKWRTTPT